MTDAKILGMMLWACIPLSAVVQPIPARAEEPNAKLPPVVGGHYDYPVSARQLDQQG